MFYFGSTNAPGSAPWEDPDGDGANNELEYVTGTNPLRAGDGWSIGIQTTGTYVDVDFTRIANRGFEVLWSSDSTDPNSWQPLDVPGNEPVFAATNSAVTVQDALTNGAGKFYRVRVLNRSTAFLGTPLAT